MHGRKNKKKKNSTKFCENLSFGSDIMSSHFLTQYGGQVSQFLSFCGRILVARGVRGDDRCWEGSYVYGYGRVNGLFFCIWRRGSLHLILCSFMHSVRASIFSISIIYHQRYHLQNQYKPWATSSPTVMTSNNTDASLHNSSQHHLAQQRQQN